MAGTTSNPASAELSYLIEDTLSSLCIPPSLLGYPYLAYSIKQVVLNPLRIKGLGTQIYQEIAECYSTNQKAVDRDVRTAIQTCWNCGGRETLDKIAHRHLVQRPWATEFVAIVAQYIKREYYR